MRENKKEKIKITNILKRQFGKDWDADSLGGAVGEFEALIEEEKQEDKREIKHLKEIVKIYEGAVKHVALTGIPENKS